MAGLSDKINDIKNNVLGNTALQQLDRKKIIGILFVALVLIYLDIAFLMSLQLKSISKAGKDSKKLKSDIAQFKREFAQQQHAKASSPMTKEIISEAEIPLLLQDITDMANRNNVKILQLNPAREVVVGRGKKGATAVSALKPNLIALDLICDYHDLGAFINDIENAIKFMAVEELKISQDSGSMFQQSVMLVIKTYVKK